MEPGLNKGDRRLALEQFFLRNWQRRGVLMRLLLPLSWLFGCLIAARRCFFLRHPEKARRVPVPVVVVGNLFVGGTGKTPLTIWLVETLRTAGFYPGVVSRGYGMRGTVTRHVHAESCAREVGDEPLLIAQRAGCPVVVGRDRGLAAATLLIAYPKVNVIIADDGLQHYRLARDVEIVLFDGRGMGNGWLLPAGPLREPVNRARDFTVLNSADGVNFAPGVPDDAVLMRLEGKIAWQLGNPEQTRLLATFARTQQARILAVAGIGHPERFFGMLRALGLQFDCLALPDHADFTEYAFANISMDVILMTEKDAVKCRQFETLKNDPRIWVVPVTAQLDGAFAARIVEKIRGYPIA